jgi:hypothetical protein
LGFPTAKIAGARSIYPLPASGRECRMARNERRIPQYRNKRGNPMQNNVEQRHQISERGDDRWNSMRR